MPRTSLSASYARFTMGNYPIPLLPPSRYSLSKAWSTTPPHFVPASILQHIKICTHRLVLLLFGHVVGQVQGVCFMSIFCLDLMPGIFHPFSSFGAWYVRLMSEILGTMSDQTSNARWKSVKFYGYRATRPNLHVNRTCRGYHAVSMCVHVRLFMVYVQRLYYQYHDTGITIYFSSFFNAYVWFGFRYGWKKSD